MNIELADNNIIMVEETVTVIKLEEDRGGFLASGIFHSESNGIT